MKITLARLIVAVLVIWLVVVQALFTAFALNSGDAKVKAVLGMVSGLIVLWVVIGGIAMYTFRDKAKAVIQGLSGYWRIKFVVFATVLALLEEAVTVGMTNLAPAFGVKIGEAYITASANYFDVVLLHSVIVFIPMFIAWALILARYDFSPMEVFLLFGLTGTLAESVSFGLQNFIQYGMWTFVYGLMVYLPAYTVPLSRTAKKPKPWIYPIAVVLPILFAIPLAIVIGILHPVAIHFPPL